jgi:hypothetical protein
MHGERGQNSRVVVRVSVDVVVAVAIANRPQYLGAFRAQRIAIAGQSPRLPFPCAGRGRARRLGRFRRPCTEHRVHDLADISGKNCFAEN